MRKCRNSADFFSFYEKFQKYFLSTNSGQVLDCTNRLKHYFFSGSKPSPVPFPGLYSLSIFPFQACFFQVTGSFFLLIYAVVLIRTNNTKSQTIDDIIEASPNAKKKENNKSKPKITFPIIIHFDFLKQLNITENIINNRKQIRVKAKNSALQLKSSNTISNNTVIIEKRTPNEKYIGELDNHIINDKKINVIEKENNTFLIKIFFLLTI